MRLIFGFGILLLTLSTQSQTVASFSQFNLLQSHYYPSVSCVSNDIDIFAHYRLQWVGAGTKVFDQQTLGAAIPLSSIRSGLALDISNERIGLSRISQLGVSYAYKVLDKKKLKLSIALSGKLTQLKLHGNEIITPQGSYTAGLINHSDDILPTDIVSGFAPSIAFSMSLQANDWNIHLSATSLNKPYIINSGGTRIVSVARNFLAGGHYRFLKYKKHELTFTGLVITDLTNTQFSSCLGYEYAHGLLLQVLYRGYTKKTNDAVSAMIGYKWRNKLTLMYSYDVSLSQLRSFQGGSHEVGLYYKIGTKTKKPDGRIIYNPRFL